MIWPEFEDQSGSVILDDTIPVPKTGTALMWIIIILRKNHLIRPLILLKSLNKQGYCVLTGFEPV